MFSMRAETLSQTLAAGPPALALGLEPTDKNAMSKLFPSNRRTKQ